MYTKIAISLLFVCLSISTSHGQQDWVTFYGLPDSTFSVEVPAPMTKQEKVVDTEMGQLTTVAYTYEGDEEDKNKLYMINEVQYPTGTFPEDSLLLMTDYLEAAIETAARAITGELLYAHRLDTDDYVGFLFRIKYNEGKAVMKGYSILHNDVFYMVKAYAHTDDSLNDDMNIYLESFTPRN